MVASTGSRPSHGLAAAAPELRFAGERLPGWNGTAGQVLPFGVLLTLVLIVGPAAALRRGPESSTDGRLDGHPPHRLAVPVGKGIAKPSFWSVELGLPAFLSTRPVTNGQIVAAKMRAAAFSTLLAWAVLLVAAPIWLGSPAISTISDRSGELLRDLLQPVRLGDTDPALFAAVVLTWNFMIGSIWSGMSGRPLLYSGAVVLSAVCFVGMLVLLTWCMDSPASIATFFGRCSPGSPGRSPRVSSSRPGSRPGRSGGHGSAASSRSGPRAGISRLDSEHVLPGRAGMAHVPASSGSVTSFAWPRCWPVRSRVWRGTSGRCPKPAPLSPVHRRTPANTGQRVLINMP